MGLTTTSPLPTSTTELLALLQTLKNQLRLLVIKAIAAGLTLPPEIFKYLDTTTYIFTQDLTLGDKNNDVYNLQLYLIAKQTGFSAEGLQKVGATGLFGPLTQAALAEYQKANGISPAAGYFGVKTRALINEGR